MAGAAQVKQAMEAAASAAMMAAGLEADEVVYQEGVMVVMRAVAPVVLVVMAVVMSGAGTLAVAILEAETTAGEPMEQAVAMSAVVGGAGVVKALVVWVRVVAVGAAQVKQAMEVATSAAMMAAALEVDEVVWQEGAMVAMRAVVDLEAENTVGEPMEQAVAISAVVGGAGVAKAQAGQAREAVEGAVLGTLAAVAVPWVVLSAVAAVDMTGVWQVDHVADDVVMAGREMEVVCMEDAMVMMEVVVVVSTEGWVAGTAEVAVDRASVEEVTTVVVL